MDVVATRQGGPVSVRQLEAAGVSERAASRRAAKGDLHRLHRGVYAVGHRSMPRVAELRAALLACGEGAVVSHGTAAALWGLRDRWPALIDVTVPNQRGRKLDGIRCPAQHLVVETDGRETHETPVAFQRDRRRDQVLLSRGCRVARATWDQIHGEVDAVVARIADALAEAR